MSKNREKKLKKIMENHRRKFDTLQNIKRAGNKKFKRQLAEQEARDEDTFIIIKKVKYKEKKRKEKDV